MENVRGALVMIAAMIGFAIEDMFVKWLTADIPIGQLLTLLGGGGALIFGVLTKIQGARLFTADFFHRAVILRNMGEIVGTIGFVTALALTPLSSASAILQATPLVVTLGAALFMGATVGWRRWSAIFVGFLGVLLIIRPGLDAFEPASLFAVLAVMGLATRDLATRASPSYIGAMQLSAYAFGVLVVTGFVLLGVQGESFVPMDLEQWGYMSGALIAGALSYYGIVVAMRLGEVAVVTPFRYSRLIIAIAIGVLVFDEHPDAFTLLGAAIVVTSGVYTLLREARINRRARRNI